jgi:PAS domain S-box-containing protein
MMDRLNKKIIHLEIKGLLEDYPSLQQIFYNIDQVVWILDPSDNHILYVSPAFEVVWGLTSESLYADPSTLINSVHPEDRVKVMSAGFYDPRKPLNLSYRIVRPDGSLRWISTHSFLIHKESSEASYQVCVAQDITGQNQVALTLQKALDRSREQFTLSRRMSLARKPEAVLKTLMSASELRNSKRAFVLFFESPSNAPSSELELITSWSSVPYSTSPYPVELFPEASLFEDLALLDLFHPSKPVIVTKIGKDERLTPAIRDLLLKGQIKSMAIFPLVALGKWLGCLLVLFPAETHFDLVELRQIKVLVDQAAITLHNLQLLEIEAESRHEAERANEIKTEFLAMISHELRTPLTSIIGFTTTLLAEDVAWGQDEQKDFVQTIQQEADRLQELIDRLLDLSRLEAGMMPITLEPYSLGEVIKDALPQLQTLTSKHNFIIHLPANLPKVSIDPKRIAQVLVNLVRNAATYAPVGTEIVISANVRGSSVQVNVSDQGPGIMPSEHKRVFKAFQRGVSIENGPAQGAGLGLAICKGLVEAHGGHIWILKKHTPGVKISFTLPLFPRQPILNTTSKGG